LKNSILGRPEILKLNVIGKAYNVNICTNEQTNLNSILREYRDVFKGPDRFKKKLKIHVKDDAKPFSNQLLAS